MTSRIGCFLMLNLASDHSSIIDANMITARLIFVNWKTGDWKAIDSFFIKLLSFTLTEQICDMLIPKSKLIKTLITFSNLSYAII